MLFRSVIAATTPIIPRVIKISARVKPHCTLVSSKSVRATLPDRVKSYLFLISKTKSPINVHMYELL